MKRRFKTILTLLVVFALCLPTAAFAEMGAEESTAAGTQEDYGILDGEALTEIVESYCAAKGLKKENISIGYCYTATGDTWYYNGDNWYYSASMYKVPVMMILAERYVAGEITDETKIAGLTLAEANRHVLVNSNNDYAHAMMHYIGTDAECRTLYQQYSDLPEDYYVQDFYDYSYFTAHFMTDVMKTLYYEPERFPNVIESLKLAQRGHYFQSTITDYEVAQKYGSFEDVSHRIFNHTTGIIFTPHPFVLTVMTKNMGQSENILADLAKRYESYTLSLDEALAAYQAAQEEEERLAREEEERLQSEQPPQEADVEQTGEPERTETFAPVAQASAPEDENALVSADTMHAEHGTTAGKAIAVAVIAISALLLLYIAAKSGRQARGRRRRTARRR